MRIWLLALASCWTGPVVPAPVARVAAATPVAARPALKPGGYFVQDLIAHRLETRAFEDVDVVDVVGGEFAVFARGPVARRRPSLATDVLIRFNGSLPSLSPTLANFMEADVRAVIEYCIDVTGRVTSAHVSTRGDTRRLDAVAPRPSDRDVLESLRGWRFTPYFVDGKPVMACSFIDYSTIAP
jgi:hypothetical protein